MSRSTKSERTLSFRVKRWKEKDRNPEPVIKLQGVRAGKPQFDPLEPRVLMSTTALNLDLATLQPAQQQHDVLVQMIAETTTTNAQTQTVQRVQILDQTNNNAVLAVGDLSSISQINIIDGPGSNRITIDAAPIAGYALPQVAVSGDGGANALVIDNSSAPGATPETWTVTGTNAGSGSGAVNVAFTDVQSLVGSGTDILAGPTANTTWNITGPGSGNVDGMAFSGFYHLQGAANNEDTFVFSPGGAMAGGIDGGPAATIRWS